MRYTFKSGVERRFSEKLKTSFRFILPLLAIFVLVVLLGISSNSPTPKKKPLTLGIYTIKSDDGGSASGNNSNSGNSSSQDTSTSHPAAMSTSLPDTSGLASSGSNLPSGGLGGVPSSPPSTGSTPPAGGLGGGTVPTCSLNQIATYTCLVTQCTPNVTLNSGQKAILGLDGTCVVIN